MNFDFELLGIQACLISLIFPFLISHLYKRKYILPLISVLFILISIYLRSRLLFITIFLSLFFTIKKKINFKYLFIYFFFCTFLLIKINLNSIIGRLFIWKIIFLNIKSIPLNGIGSGSFKSNYANWQLNYFEKHKDWSVYHLLADSPSFAFNEILNSYIEYGLISLFLFIITIFINVNLLIKKTSPFIRTLTLSNLNIILFCFFSYPLHNVLIITIFICNHILILSIYFQTIKYILHSFIMLLFVLLSNFFYSNLRAKSNWHFAKTIPTNFKKEKLIEYKICYSELRKDQYFLEDLCQYYLNENMFSEAKKILLNDSKYLNQYNFNILLAQLYFKNGNLKSAFNSYRKANLIIPNRLLPLDNQKKICLLLKDTVLAKKISFQIISQPVKIESILSKRIKQEAYKTLIF